MEESWEKASPLESFSSTERCLQSPVLVTLALLTSQGLRLLSRQESPAEFKSTITRTSGRDRSAHRLCGGSHELNLES